MIPMKMSENGRVVIPAEIRQAIGLKEGDTVFWDLVDGEPRLSTRQTRLRRAQALVARYCPIAPGDSVVDEFIAERRAEAERE